ncbi:MAG: hypothetical protein DRZ82_07335 [Thermoprotei archaeon]|nr:MAG: hypothetical protein DRZ82_07335 [Thermoprotei archaeon]
MMLEIGIEDYGMIIVRVSEEYGRVISQYLPFKSKVAVWKEEVYFETPIKREEIKGNETLHVERGDLCFWRPGKALCLFYGVTQPYSPVIKLGEIIGPLYELKDVRDGASLEVRPYRDPRRYEKLLRKLRVNGITAAVKITDIESILVNYSINGIRIGIEVYIEDYGFPMESDALFKFDANPYTLKVFKALRDLVVSYKGVRIDLNEDNYVCISSFAKNEDELVNRIKEVSAAYFKAIREINIVPGV